MANEQAKDPSAKKGIAFALAPFAGWLVVLLIALNQSGALKKATSAQNANAGTDNRQELKQCYAKLGVSARGIDTADSKTINDFLFDCRKELENKS